MPRIVSPYEFERQYAERSGMPVEKLRELGRVVIRCDCGDERCEGWQSVNREDARADGYALAPVVTQTAGAPLDRGKWYY